MWTQVEIRKLIGGRALRALVLLAVLGLTAAWTAWAAPQEGSAAGSAGLRQLIESRYEVLPVSGGVLLRPRQPRAGVQTIEVMGGSIAINGQRVQERTVREWLEADADPVLRLRSLSPDEQRRTFGLAALTAAERAAAEARAAEATAAEEIPTSGEVTEVTSDVAEEAGVPEPPAPPEIPEPAEPAEPVTASDDRRSSGPRVNVGGSVTVDEDEIADEVVAVGGSATVDGEVRDSVTAIGGPARINGRVGGEVVSVGSSVILGPNAVVEGDVTSVGGRIRREPGAVIEGSTSEVGILPFAGGRDHDWGGGGLLGGFSDILGAITSLVLMGLLVCLVLLVARNPLERVSRMLESQPWPSLAAGVAGVVFLGPLLVVVTVLLVITIVGCALLLLYPFLFVYVALLFLLGYAAVAYRLGRWLEHRFNRNFGGPYAAALVGVTVLQIWTVLGQMVDMVPFMGFFAVMLLAFGAVLQAAAWIVGFGAVILSRFGLEPGYWPRRTVPVVPVPPPPAGTPPDSLPLTSAPVTDPPADHPWEEPGTYPEPPR